ncbi:MAG TPA: hypothetical protein VGC95_10675, partial [Chitinophagaceae bacterium]
MIPALRKSFNENFTKEKYNAFVEELAGVYPGQLEFRVAETPVFVGQEFKSKMLETCEKIVDVILAPDFKELTEAAVPPGVFVPNEDAHTHFIAFDFGVCVGENGRHEPQLIEMQGFPSLFAFEVLIPEISRKHFPVPDYLDC